MPIRDGEAVPIDPTQAAIGNRERVGHAIRRDARVQVVADRAVVDQDDQDTAEGDATTHWRGSKRADQRQRGQDPELRTIVDVVAQGKRTGQIAVGAGERKQREQVPLKEQEVEGAGGRERHDEADQRQAAGQVGVRRDERPEVRAVGPVQGIGVDGAALDQEAAGQDEGRLVHVGARAIGEDGAQDQGVDDEPEQAAGNQRDVREPARSGCRLQPGAGVVERPGGTFGPGQRR